MLRLARNDNGKGMRATVCSQASKTIEPCPEGEALGMNTLRILRLLRNHKIYVA